jgi:transposase
MFRFTSAENRLAWLAMTLQRIAEGWPISQIEKLMPWNHKA